MNLYLDVSQRSSYLVCVHCAPRECVTHEMACASQLVCRSKRSVDGWAQQVSCAVECHLNTHSRGLMT